MNFGAIGSIIGHELTHGLDDRGSLVGINGEFNNWWQYETGIRFIDKIKCIVEQYESYVEPITGLKVSILEIERFFFLCYTGCITHAKNDLFQ